MNTPMNHPAQPAPEARRTSNEQPAMSLNDAMRFLEAVAVKADRSNFAFYVYGAGDMARAIRTCVRALERTVLSEHITSK